MSSMLVLYTHYIDVIWEGKNNCIISITKMFQHSGVSRTFITFEIGMNWLQYIIILALHFQLYWFLGIHMTIYVFTLWITFMLFASRLSIVKWWYNWYELGRILKKVSEEGIFLEFVWKDQGEPKKPSIRIAGVARIKTERFLNTCLQCYWYINLLLCVHLFQWLLTSSCNLNQCNVDGHKN